MNRFLSFFSSSVIKLINTRKRIKKSKEIILMDVNASTKILTAYSFTKFKITAVVDERLILGIRRQYIHKNITAKPEKLNSIHLIYCCI